MGKTLSGDQIFSISYHRLVTDKDTFRTSCRTCGIEHIGSIDTHRTGCQTIGHLAIQSLRHPLLQRRRHATGQMDGKIGDHEVYGLGSAEGNHLTSGQRRGLLLHHLPQTGIGIRVAVTNDGGLLGIAQGILLEIVNKSHRAASLRSTIATILSSERRLRGVASVASRVML